MAPLKLKPKIIIIGAGISGIAAGNYLADAGLTDFVILESSDRRGGRIWSIDLETQNGQKAELGANWIHGIDQNPIFKLARQNNLLSEQYQGRQLGKKIMFLQQNGDPVNTKVVEEVDFAYGMLMSQCEDFYQSQMPTPMENDSVGAFVEREFSERFDRYAGEEFSLRHMILEQRLLGECIIAGSHKMNEVSLSEVGAFQELPGVHYVIPPGFEAVVDLLSQNIPDGNILLNHQVTQINWKQTANPDNANNFDVCVECQNGKRFYANHIIVTISLGLLKKHATRLFNPILPNFKMDAIERLSIGTVNKVILEFGGQILPDEVFRLELVWDRSDVDNQDISETWYKKIGSFEAVAKNVLMGWISGREAEYMETLPEEEVGKKCVDVIKMFLKNHIGEMPALKRVVRSTWKNNPNTLGSYMFIPVGGYAEDIEALAEPINDQTDKPVIQFAGEATHPSFYSSSHGALLTGQREAQRIIDLYTQH